MKTNSFQWPASRTGEKNVSAGRGDLAKIIAATLFAALAVMTATSCGSPQEQAVVAEITTFEPSQEDFQTGSPATASVRIKNVDAEKRTLWIGYSVQDPAEHWYDAPASPVELASGEESDTRELSTKLLQTPGYYNARVSVWSEEPGESSGVGRLADANEVSAFRVFSTGEDFDRPELDPDQWVSTTRDLGRGALAPQNVTVENGQLRLTLPANTLDGGEIESKDLYGPGFYAARIKVPNAPSSITGFFLYEAPDYASEIDIEIYNDSSGKILFTTYSGGEQTNTETLTLPFDPTEDFHDYAFFYNQDFITFYADGEPMKEYRVGLPDKPMKLYVNSWFPKWLDGEKPDSDRYTYIDWINK